MTRLGQFFVRALVSGFLLAVPVYLAVLLMLKGMKSLAGLVRPLASLHPQGMSSAVAEQVLAFLLIMIACFLLGTAVLTTPGRAVRDRVEQSVLAKIPGYLLVKGLTRQLAGQRDEHLWKPAVVELGASHVLAFIIEQTDDGRYVVFVPSVPSPVVGSVHILRRERVYPANVSFAQTFNALSRWGSGATNIVAAAEGHRDRQPEVKAS